MTETATANKLCLKCQTEISAESRFCKHCGAVQTEPDPLSTDERLSNLTQLTIFFGIEVLICLVAKFTDLVDSRAAFLVVDFCLATNALVFFAYNWQFTNQVLAWPNFSLQKLCVYCGIAFTGSVLVHYSVGWLNQTIFPTDDYYVSFFEGSRYFILIHILLTAVFPALFEELGFRGYMIQGLLKVVDQWQAIAISALLFAFIHISFISLFWMIPFGLFLGYARIKEKTIWYGVFFHFCFNLGACIFELM